MGFFSDYKSKGGINTLYKGLYEDFGLLKSEQMPLCYALRTPINSVTHTHPGISLYNHVIKFAKIAAKFVAFCQACLHIASP